MWLAGIVLCNVAVSATIWSRVGAISGVFGNSSIFETSSQCLRQLLLQGLRPDGHGFLIGRAYKPTQPAPALHLFTLTKVLAATCHRKIKPG